MSVEVVQFICLTDNFGLLLRDEATGAVASIDAPDARAIAAELHRDVAGGSPIFSLTHHHADHIQGVRGAEGALSAGARRRSAQGIGTHSAASTSRSARAIS